MKTKIFVFALLALFLAGVSVVRMSSDGKQKELAELEKASDRGTVDWFVRLAKIKGQRRITIPAPVVEYVTGIESMDEALQYYDVVIAEPIAKQSIATERTVDTWYKFRIIERLSSKRISTNLNRPISSDYPSDLSPLTVDEVLARKTGGSVAQNGIQVDMIDGQFPEFVISQRYLLFLETDWSSQVARIPVGPGGVFIVESDGKLRSINNEPHPLKKFIRGLYGNTLSTLREKMGMGYFPCSRSLR